MLYNQAYLRVLDERSELCLGGISNKFSKEPVVDDTIRDALTEYTYLKVKEHLGLTFIEYLDTNILIKKQYRDFLEILATATNQQLADISESVNELGGAVNE